MWLFCYDLFNSSCYRALQKLCTDHSDVIFSYQIIIMETSTVIFILQEHSENLHVRNVCEALCLKNTKLSFQAPVGLIMEIMPTEARSDPSTRIMTSISCHINYNPQPQSKGLTRRDS